MSLSLLSAELQIVMERLSNSEPVEVPENIIEEAVEDFRNALVKQLSRDPDEAFRLRMSNIGRAPCQLQMEKSGAERSRKPANHILRMMIGDAVEVYLTAMLKLANANITGGKDIVEFGIADTVIKGESDIDIDGAVWDIKSSSSWAFKNKWKVGYDALRKSDDFGYIGQLFGYSEGQKKPMGGWIVADKSSGEVVFVEATPSDEEKKEIRKSLESTIRKVESNAPFERCFSEEPEYFYRKPTGSKRLPMACSFCDYRAQCWPDATYQPQTGSQAKEPKYYWYTKYNAEYGNEGN
jgi:hypothetical protein